MSLMLRIALVAGAVIVLVMIARKLRKAQIQVMDSVFWLVFAFSFVLLAVFPQIAYALSDLLGVQSPSNFVFLYVVGVLLVKEFSNTVKIAELRRKQVSLVQEMALREIDKRM